MKNFCNTSQLSRFHHNIGRNMYYLGVLAEIEEKNKKELWMWVALNLLSRLQLTLEERHHSSLYLSYSYPKTNLPTASTDRRESINSCQCFVLSILNYCFEKLLKSMAYNNCATLSMVAILSW